MYKVLIVDDEAHVREGLAQEVDRTVSGFQVAGTAENGIEAMELCDRLEPDVVITDIGMPYMDGLELAEWLREHHPFVKIVILTGYDEFDYAQQAVRLRIEDYVLKPFSSDHLSELLAKLGDRLETEAAERADILQLKEHYRTSLPLLRANFLSSLLYRKLPHETAVEKAAAYGLRITGSRYMMSIISLHGHTAESNTGSRQSLYCSGDTDLKLFAVKNIACEAWERAALGYAFIHQDEIVLLSVDSLDTPDWERRTSEALEGIIRNIARFLKMTVTIGAGSLVSRITDIPDSYEEARQALHYRLVHGAGKIIFIRDVERGAGKKLRFDALREQTLIRCLKAGTAEELREETEAVFQELTGGFSYSDIQLYLIEMATLLLKTAKDTGLETEELFGAGLPLYAELFQLSGLEEAKRLFLDHGLAIRKHLSSSRQHAYKDIVGKAVAYIKEHYHDPELSIQKICSLQHVSVGYFCTIFKKEAGLTFVQYVMHIRMEAAKELLQSTDLKAFEIAERVGFAEPNYFSYCFKKQTGMSPREFRSRRTGAKEACLTNG